MREGKLQGDLFTECAGWIWEQLQEDGFFLAGELVELILETERSLDIVAEPLDTIAAEIERDLARRGVAGNPSAVDARLIRQVLEWEDDFLGFAGIARADA